MPYSSHVSTYFPHGASLTCACCLIEELLDAKTLRKGMSYDSVITEGILTPF